MLVLSVYPYLQSLMAYERVSLTSAPWRARLTVDRLRASQCEIEWIGTRSWQSFLWPADAVMGIEVAVCLGDDREIVIVGLETPAGFGQCGAIAKRVVLADLIGIDMLEKSIARPEWQPAENLKHMRNEVAFANAFAALKGFALN